MFEEAETCLRGRQDLKAEACGITKAVQMYQEIKKPCAYENKDLRFNPNTPIDFN